MAKAAKVPKVSPIVDGPDPADAFTRADPPPIDDGGVNGVYPDPAYVDPPPPIDDEKPRKKKGGARAPAVVAKNDDDDSMDPFDAAQEIIALTDGAFAMLCSVRGYNTIAVEVNGQRMLVLEMVSPDEKAKERLRKALARVLKSAGATMSPGAGLALSAFGCYGAPIMALEMAKAKTKKAPTV